MKYVVTHQLFQVEQRRSSLQGGNVLSTVSMTERVQISEVRDKDNLRVIEELWKCHKTRGKKTLLFSSNQKKFGAPVQGLDDFSTLVSLKNLSLSIMKIYCIFLSREITQTNKRCEFPLILNTVELMRRHFQYQIIKRLILSQELSLLLLDEIASKLRAAIWKILSLMEKIQPSGQQ